MKKLILIITFVLFGAMANAAMAAKQVKDADILLTAGPLVGTPLCDVRNNTDQDIDVLVAFCVADRDADDDPPDCSGWSVITLRADQHFGIGDSAIGLLSTASAACEVSYHGQPGDVTGTYCSVGVGCIDLK